MFLRRLSMKKCVQYFAIIFTIILLFCSFATTAFAKELEPCRLCGGKGDYHCIACGNTGTVICDGCGGAGGSKCQGDTYKGNPCDNGYYTCGSCNGDGKNRSGDGKIFEGVCGNCGGAGKLRCVVCSNGTPGWNACTRCGGSGKHECQVETCKVSRQYGWHCPDCKGTGFILVGNPMPPKENNDGVRNVPVKGDYIVTNDKTWAGYTYGGGSGQSGNEGQSDRKQTETNPPVTSDTKPKTTAEPENTETTSKDEPSPEITVQLPNDRTTDFSLTQNRDGDKKPTASVAIEMAKMSEKESEYYASLSDEELGTKLTNVQKIVSTASPGRFEEGYEDALNKIAEQNGLSSLEEGRILPIYFEGHEDVGFPVKVTVKLEKGVLKGGSDLFIYHIAENGSIEELGKAEYHTYEDGSIETIFFFTTSFSSFFTAKKQLDIAVAEQIFAGAAAVTDINTGNNNNESNSHNIYILVAIIAVAVIVIAVLSAVFIKKRKSKV